MRLHSLPMTLCYFTHYMYFYNNIYTSTVSLASPDLIVLYTHFPLSPYATTFHSLQTSKIPLVMSQCLGIEPCLQ